MDRLYPNDHVRIYPLGAARIVRVYPGGRGGTALIESTQTMTPVGASDCVLVRHATPDEWPIAAGAYPWPKS
jgi:hypothetical protein